MNIAKASDSTELDPVVIEYEETIGRIRKNGSSLVDVWIARMRPLAVKLKVEHWRKSKSSPSSDDTQKASSAIRET